MTNREGGVSFSNNESKSYEFMWFESNEVDLSTCLEHLEAFKLVQKKDHENNLGKKCYAIELNWYKSFMLYGQELEAREAELKKQQVQLNAFRHQVQVEHCKPGPIDNLKLVELEPHYTNKYKFLHQKAPNEWHTILTDWNFMSLKEDIELGVDFKLVSEVVWSKLVHLFGGAPSIFFYAVKKGNNAEDIDLKPIKVQVRGIDQPTDDGQLTIGCLVSPFIGCKVFAQLIANYFHLPPTKTLLYLYCPEEADENKIMEIVLKGNQSMLLNDYGVKDGSVIIVKQQLEVDNQGNVLDEIAKALNIPLISKSKQFAHNLNSDYYSEIQQQQQQQFSKKRKGTPKHSNVETSFQPQSWAAQYEDDQNDPDLLYALQASLQDNNLGGNVGGNGGGVDNYNDWLYDDNQHPIAGYSQLGGGKTKQRTPSTAEHKSDKSFGSNQALNNSQNNSSFADPKQNKGAVPKITVEDLKDKKSNRNSNSNKRKGNGITKPEKMKMIRQEKKQRFDVMRERAQKDMRQSQQQVYYSESMISQMGPIKSFRELQESILKLRENFNNMLGKNAMLLSPLKQNDLMNEIGDQEISKSANNKIEEIDSENQEIGKIIQMRIPVRGTQSMIKGNLQQKNE